METSNTSIPKWILIVTGLFAIMEILVSISMFSNPSSVMNDITNISNELKFAVEMWAVRQFALGIILGYSILKKSIPMFQLSYIFFLVMFIGDGVVGYMQNQMPLVYTAIIMCLFACSMLYALKGIEKN